MSASALASPSIPLTAKTGTQCCVMPTPPCTKLNKKVRAPTYEHLGARPASNESLLLLLADDTAYDQDECDWVHDVLCKALAAYMGPVAPLVCRETISAAGGVDSPDTVRRVVDDLAAEIGNADEAESFRRMWMKIPLNSQNRLIGFSECHWFKKKQKPQLKQFYIYCAPKTTIKNSRNLDTPPMV